MIRNQTKHRNSRLWEMFASPREVISLSADKIELHPTLAREKQNAELMGEILLLAHSIREIGIQEPLLVIRSGQDRYLLIGGLKRYFAAMLLHEERIPCIVAECDEDALDEYYLKFRQN